jgi:hypothetical protein
MEYDAVVAKEAVAAYEELSTVIEPVSVNSR